MPINETQSPSSFSQAFASALATTGVSLSRLHRRLVDHANPVSIATLSYWRSGERAPEGSASLAAVEDIERLLGLETGALVSRIPERVRLGTVNPSELPFTEAEVTQALTETLELLDAPRLDLTREVSSHIVTDVDARGFLSRRATRALVQSVSPQIIDALTYTTVSAHNTLRQPDITVKGARLVREHLHASGHAYACVLELDASLAPGETTILELVMHRNGESASQPESGAFVVRRVRDLVLWTRFHPEAIPDWVEELERAEATGETVRRALRPQASVHQTRRDFGPGTLGIRWGYDQE